MPIRGVAVGALSTALTLAAHATGGGMLPDPAVVLSLLGVGAVLGLTASTLAWVRSTWLGLLAALGIGQFAGHVLLTLTSMDPHAPSSPLMLTAHALAGVAAAALVVSAERVLPAAVATLARVVPVRLAPQVVRVQPTNAPVPVRVSPIRQVLVRSSLARRGPPVSA